MTFERENVKKMGFLKVFTYYARTSRIVAYLIEQGAPVRKWTTLPQEKKSSGPKNFKNGLFWVFTQYCTKSLRNFTVVLR